MAIIVARYLPDGRLDPNFGDGGTVRTDTADGSVHAVAIGGGDRITVIAGGDGLQVVRYLETGELDQAFGQGGTANGPFFPPIQSSIFAAILDARPPVIATASAPAMGGMGSEVPGAARIVAAGSMYVQQDGIRNFALARYRLSGEPDPAFSGDGRVRTAFQEGHSEARGVRVDREGRTVAAGSVAAASGLSQFALARYMPDGDLDSEFGGDGRVVTQFTEGWSAARAVTVDGLGRILAAGVVQAAEGGQFALARFREDGVLDSSFSGNGRVRTGFQAGDSEVHAVAIDGRGRFVAAGSAGAHFALARFRQDGVLDSSFSGDGRVVTAFTEGSSMALALLIDVVAETITVVGRVAGQFALARFREDGVLDSSFSGDGRVRTVIAEDGEISSARAVAVDSQHRIIVAGDVSVLDN
jgi:uncharacterized delta-60 repeat protein